MSARYPVDSLTVYEEDDETVLFEVSTDGAHQAPYLKPFANFPEQEIDFAKGSATIEQMGAQIVDVPTDPTDQDTGYLTGLLSDPSGASQLVGHRVLAQRDVGAGAETVLDGVLRSVRLMDTFSGFDLELRDIRERERKTVAFARGDTATVLPRGVLNGYGVLKGGRRYPVPATEPVAAVFQDTGTTGGGADSGVFRFADATRDPRLIMDAAMREALYSLAPWPDHPETLVFDRWKLRWRPAAGGSWTTITNVRYSPEAGITSGPYTNPFVSNDIVNAVGVENLYSGATLPSDTQSVEIIVQYDGPVTEDWPLHLQDLTVGRLLRNLYRGDYSDRDPRIRYDESALLALNTPVRAIIDEPVDDLREWAEKNAYPIAHAAPTLNAAGEISPVTYLLPDATVSVPTISDSNAAPDGGGWSHGAEDAINLVRVTYKRDFAKEKTKNGSSPTGELFAVDVTVTVPLPESIALLGERKLEISPVLLRAIGFSNGQPFSGDVLDETAVQVATRIGYMATDRFSVGGQYFSLLGMRTDSDIEGLKVGGYAVVGVSWHPDYNTGERGANRLAQVLGRRNVDAAWTRLTLIDAGSANSPVTQPTLGTVTVDTEGVVSVPVTRPTDGVARVDYAISDTEPAASAGLWTFLGRAGFPNSGAVTEVTLTAPPVPPGSTVWVRARGERAGRRPSAYTTPVSVTASSPPRILEAALELDYYNGTPEASWQVNDQVLGIRIHYEVHLTTTTPTFASTVDVDAADGLYEFASLRVPLGKVISIRLEPWTGWTGSAVSGTAGALVEKRLLGEREPIAPWVQAEFDRDAEDETATLTLTVRDWRGAVTAVEFSKREGSQAGDAFGAYSSAWDSAPSTPPYGGSYVESVAVPGGEESAIKWRVTFLDVDGTARTIGGTHATAMVDEYETVAYYNVRSLNPDSFAEEDSPSDDYLQNEGDSVDRQYTFPLDLPIGVTLTEFHARVYREHSFSPVSGYTQDLFHLLYDVDDDGAPISSISIIQIASGATTGWVTISDTTLNDPVVDAYAYYVQLHMHGGAQSQAFVHAEDLRTLWVMVKYLKHTSQQNR